MGTFYITEQYTILKKEDERIKLYKGKELLVEIPIIKINAVIVFGEVTVTASTLKLLADNNITISYFTIYGKFISRFECDFKKNVVVRLNQYQKHIEEDTESLSIAKMFIKGKIKNSRTVLMKNLRGKESEKSKAVISELNILEKKISETTNLDSLRGLEGRSAAIYFSVFDEMIKGTEFKFSGRNKRPPRDPVNAMLSFGYSLLANEMSSALSSIGIDSYLGFLHRLRYGRTSLALDLMEEFRSAFVDRLVLNIINNKILNSDDFENTLGEVKMSKKAIKKFLGAYEAKKNDTIMHPTFKYKTTYQQCFHLQARILSKTIMNEMEYVPFLIR